MANKNKVQEIGESGTYIFDGVIDEEYKTILAGTDGIAKYDEMRRSDATVKAIITAMQLPIRRAHWFIQPASQDEKDVEISDFINSALFSYMSITWDDFLRQSLLSLPYGVMLFEKVFVSKDDKIIWQKFAPRLPSSVNKWQTKAGKDGITQLLVDGNEVSIPMDKLLIFVNDKEGDNWWGVSVLRAAYKHWYMKFNLEKIDVMAHERQGLGIPFVKLKKVSTAADRTAAETILKNIRANEKSYLIEPSDMEVGFKDMKANTTKDPTSSLAYHNRQITVSVLAQFLDLGSGDSGSRALSQDQSEIFLQSLEAVANNIKDVINKYAIKQLVDLNYDNVDKYPEVRYSGIERIDVAKLSDALQKLTSANMIKPSEADEQHLRGILNLPEIQEESKEDIEEKEIEEKEIEDLGLSELIRKKKITESELKDCFLEKIGNMTMAEQIDFLNTKIEAINKIKNNRIFFDKVSNMLTNKISDIRTVIFQENDFKSWRKLTFAEKKVNFKSIQDTMDKLEDKFDTKATAILTASKNTYIDTLNKAVIKQDKATIVKATVKFKTEYTALVKDTLKESFEFGKSNVAKEMGIKAPAHPRNVMMQIDIAASTIAAKHAEELAIKAKLTLVNQLGKGETTAKSIGMTDAALTKQIEKMVRNTSRVVVSGYINTGRRSVFDKFSNKIYALQRSEILDEKTCNYCLSLDGRIVEKTDPITKIGNIHSNCRGIWVEILKTEEEKPTISGIPKSLRNRVEDTNEFEQLKKPIVKKSSAAGKMLNK